jgi:hypothetical protein
MDTGGGREDTRRVHGTHRSWGGLLDYIDPSNQSGMEGGVRRDKGEGSASILGRVKQQQSRMGFIRCKSILQTTLTQLLYFLLSP